MGAVASLVLDSLVVASKSDGGLDYDRDDWNAWIDADSDCQNTRHELLALESLKPVVRSHDGCNVESGEWLDRFTGDIYTQASDATIDHLVALSEAHKSGGWAWTASRKEDFANDLDNPASLGVAGQGVNSSKGDKDPTEWKPPLLAAHCSYAIDWISVKADWELTITQQEKASLQSMLATCIDPDSLGPIPPP